MVAENHKKIWSLLSNSIYVSDYDPSLQLDYNRWTKYLCRQLIKVMKIALNKSKKSKLNHRLSTFRRKISYTTCQFLNFTYQNSFNYVEIIAFSNNSWRLNNLYKQIYTRSKFNNYIFYKNLRNLLKVKTKLVALVETIWICMLIKFWSLRETSYLSQLALKMHVS